MSSSATTGPGSTPTYTVSNYSRYLSHKGTALVDRGANGSIIGNNMRVLDPKGHGYFTHLNGIDDHTVRDLPLVQAGAYVRTHIGPVILIISHGAHMPDGKTILSPGQMEHFGWTITDKSPRVNEGKPPVLRSLEGHLMPLSVRDGLPYLHLRPFTDDEWDKLPHIHGTSPHQWDPKCLDYIVSDDWYDQQDPGHPYQLTPDYDEFGELRQDRAQDLTPDDDDDNPNVIHPVSRRDVKAYATHLITPDLVHARSVYVQTRRSRNRQDSHWSATRHHWQTH